jgi:hypothetical protein
MRSQIDKIPVIHDVMTEFFLATSFNRVYRDKGIWG